MRHSEALMDGPALRDLERWKDKIEVRLDNRQVFLLFFGSALVSCLLFVLGVMVGKRMEARGRAAAPETEDALALLDRIAQSPTALAPTPSHALVPALVAGPPAPRPQIERKAEDRPLEKSPAPAVVAKVPAREVKVALAEATAAAPAAAARVVPVPASPTPRPSVAIAEPTAAEAAPDTAAKGRYSLQLSSFPDRAQAETFAGRFTDQKTTIVPSEIPGKGLWFRVRVGDYASIKDALAAKGAIERKHGTIAYLVGPR